jgi:2-C-methyl-D-erythritol 4-phosphate cytidylyltransferase
MSMRCSKPASPVLPANKERQQSMLCLGKRCRVYFLICLIVSDAARPLLLLLLLLPYFFINPSRPPGTTA